jgi:hypothetical protein
VARRRRYKSPAISNAGRQENPPDAATEIDAPMPPRDEYGPQQTTSHQTEALHPQSFSTGLKDQLDAQRRYAQPLDGLDAFINQHYSGALPNERQWLRDHPQHMQNVPLVHAAGMVAMQRGIPRHSPEFLRAIEQLLAQHYAATQPQAPPMQHAPPPPPPMTHHIELEAEHEADRDDSEPEGEHTAARYSAPVSRGEAHSIEPELSPSQVRLSKAEREHAQAAGVSDEEYAKNKLKMEKMKKAKLIE